MFRAQVSGNFFCLGAAMGRRGPKPEPAAIKRAKGNPGHRPIGEDVPVAAGGEGKDVARVAQPDFLKGTGKVRGDARKIWDRLAPRLTAQKLLAPTDAETFGRYCVNFARWLKMQTELNKSGETYWTESQHGKMKRIDPAFVIASRLERDLQSAEASFGLNPAERQRIFAARAAAGGLAGDLFATPPQAAGHEAPPARAAGDRPAGPIGLLN